MGAVVMNTYIDMLNDSVVKMKQAVFKKGDVTPILRLMKKENEKEIRDPFEKTLSKRNKRKEAQEVVEAAVVAADKDLETMSEEALIKLITGKATKDIRKYFAKVKEARKRANHSIDAYREYMAEYIKFTHQAERYILIL